MEKVKIRHHILIAVLLIGAVALIAAVLPQHTTRRFTYDINGIWNSPDLRAPFDFEVGVDPNTRQAIADSVALTFVNIYHRNLVAGEQQVALLSRELSSHSNVSASARYHLVNRLQQLYRDGVGQDLPPVIDLRDRTTNVAHRESTAEMHSLREAYTELDSAAHRVGAASLLDVVNLSQFIVANIELDSIESQKYLKAEQDRATPPNRKIQRNETIITRGARVTPEVANVISALEHEYEERAPRIENRDLKTAGQVAAVALLMLAFYLFMLFIKRRIYAVTKRMLFLLTFITLFIVVVMLVCDIRQGFVFMVPFALVPIIVCTFYDMRTSFFVSQVVVLISALAMPVSQVCMFIIMQFFATCIALVSMQEFTRRSQLVRCALFVFVIYCLSYSVLMLSQGYTLDDLDHQYFLYFAVNAVVLSFASVGIFIVEKLFGFTSTSTLLELNDINSPLMRQLSQMCPGTFQHSLQVATLASEASLKIGANTALVQAGALYHDIGKINNPAFFTENQTGVNPHDALAPDQSAGIIIKHVTDGLKLAERYRLPQSVRDMIAQHHGRSITQYFYHKACQANPGREIDTAPYTYPGPNPQSREAAILMMADACEAAAKSLTDHGDAAITRLVDRIINSMVNDGLMREAPISFREVEVVKRTIIERLCAFYYTRIAYPDEVRPRSASAAAPDNGTRLDELDAGDDNGQ